MDVGKVGEIGGVLCEAGRAGIPKLSERDVNAISGIAELGERRDVRDWIIEGDPHQTA